MNTKTDAPDDHTSGSHDDQEDILRIERLDTTAVNSTKGTRYLNDLVRHQPINDDGSIDWKSVMVENPPSTTYNEISSMKKALVNYGRYVRYTTSVSEPTTEVVGTYQNKGGDVHEDMYEILENETPVTVDGRPDMQFLKQCTDRNGNWFDPTVIKRNVAEHLRIVLPMELYEPMNIDNMDTERSERSQPSIPEDVYVHVLGMSPEEIPMDAVEAFEMGVSKGINAGEQRAQLNEL